MNIFETFGDAINPVANLTQLENKLKKQKKINMRTLEQFELSADYYTESYINGNISHVLQELRELKKCSEKTFLRIFIDIPRELQEKFQENYK